MSDVNPEIIRDENNVPVEVRLPCAWWREIEIELGAQGPHRDRMTDLARFRGTITLSEDPLAYQRRVRGEWQ